ncbi:MAG: hypothetical protein ABFD18_18675 [Syntrophomonas sp.]
MIRNYDGYAFYNHLKKIEFMEQYKDDYRSVLQAVSKIEYLLDKDLNRFDINEIEMVMPCKPGTLSESGRITCIKKYINFLNKGSFSLNPLNNISEEYGSAREWSEQFVIEPLPLISYSKLIEIDNSTVNKMLTSVYST